MTEPETKNTSMPISVKFIAPVSVGTWHICDNQFHFDVWHRKPSWFCRVMHRLLLGWRFEPK